jgi:hypothetical protein
MFHPQACHGELVMEKTEQINQEANKSQVGESPKTPLNAHLEREMKEFISAVSGIEDSVLILLRAHLLSENLLERIIQLELARGDRIIADGNYTYSQKLVLVHALDSLDDGVIQSLKNLNKVRNKCAHELGQNIGKAEIELIGSPLGKKFTEIKRTADFVDSNIFEGLLGHLCGFLSGHISRLEVGETRAKPNNPKQK